MPTDPTPEEPATPDHLERQLVTLERRLVDQEHKLLEQEHRLWPAIRNFLASRDLQEESEEAQARYRAARSALVRRLVFRPGAVSIAVGGVGLAGILVAAWTALLFQQQNLLFKEQNAHFRAQNVELRAQNEKQAADTLIVRRAQLLGMIYDCAETVQDPEPICKPIANARAREEALRAFVAIENGRKVQLDLENADLSGLRLGGVDLIGAKLFGAKLNGAHLPEAKLNGAYFGLANLNGANLGGTDLSGAYLRGAKHLTQKQIDSADGDSSTKLPPDLTRPPHWPTTAPNPPPPSSELPAP